MHRDVAGLSGRTFDLLVVGGGIYGLTIAYDAAQRGLEVALIERADFGSGSSFNHLRTIHGGLRYLQTLNVRRARESIEERRTLARIAPHAVRPLPFVLPLARSLTRGRLAMRAGFLLDELIGVDRNRDLPAALWLPSGRVVSREEAVERFPELARTALTGAAVWYDYTTPESDRLTLAWALAAHQHGAVLANYTEAIEALVTDRRVTGVRAVDRQGGRTLQIDATLTVNATGAEVARLPGRHDLPMNLPLVKAMNLVTRRQAPSTAIGGRSTAGRHLFQVPWRNRALFGTWESRRPYTLAEMDPTEPEVAGFISELNDAFPGLELTRGDVTLVHRGLVPGVLRDDHIALDGREQFRDHELRDGRVAGLVSVAGAKYTTARATAERVTDRIMRRLGRRRVPCRTASTPLPGGDLRDVSSTVADAARDYGDLPPETIRHLVAAHGSRFRVIAELAASRSGWREPLTSESPVIKAELVHAVRDEMAVTLSDAVIRRTPLGALGFPGEAAARSAADLLAGELGWSEERTRRELNLLRDFYTVK
jgi:glycerol-3-phosphate dehydrogenase